MSKEKNKMNQCEKVFRRKYIAVKRGRKVMCISPEKLAKRLMIEQCKDNYLDRYS